MSTRPVIGITAYEEQARWNQWDARASLLPARYVHAVTAAGGLALLIPVQELSPETATELLGRLDGVILSGGPDVNPGRYGEVAHERTSVPREERDAVETTLVESVHAAEVPTLAICRGLQLLNVARGGTLVQHLPDTLGHEDHSPSADGYGSHEVRVEPGSLLAGSLGWERAGVPTHHHQAIGRLGGGLVATAWTDDGVIEAVEDRSVPFLLGVQWHPEAGDDLGVFRALVAAARRSSEEAPASR